MNLDDLEQEMLMFTQTSTDCYEADFGRKFIPKLIAIAKAVSKELVPLNQCGFLEIVRAFQDLVKSEKSTMVFGKEDMDTPIGELIKRKNEKS